MIIHLAKFLQNLHVWISQAFLKCASQLAPEKFAGLVQISVAHAERPTVVPALVHEVA